MVITIGVLFQVLADGPITELCEGEMSLSAVLLEQSCKDTLGVAILDSPFGKNRLSSHKLGLTDSSVSSLVECLELNPKMVVELEID